MPSLIPRDRPVVRHVLDAWVDPATVFSTVYADLSTRFWLDSGEYAEAGMTFLGAGASPITASALHGTVSEDGRSRSIEFLGDLRERMAARHPYLGWVGWLGYELRTQTMGVPLRDASTSMAGRDDQPDALLMAVEHLIAFDHERRTVELVAAGDSWSAEAAAWRDDVLAALASAVEPAQRPSDRGHSGRSVWAVSDEQYLADIRECQRHIGEGDAYQLCLTTSVAVEGVFDPLTVWLALRSSNPSHHGGLIEGLGVALVSSSPERFLAVEFDGTVESKPIKGTRPRSSDPVVDDALRADLLGSEKERAENLMIVDLVRNDLGRVSKIGSVSVPSLLAVETYSHVHQLVSTVQGTLAPGLSALDAIEACFPAGSMTGAPKRRATELLDRIEGRPRGIYSGAFGYLSADGTADLAMVIRSIVIDGHGATIGAGGGITAPSVPEEELAEVKLKAASLLRVLGVS